MGRLIAGEYIQKVSYDNATVVEVPFEFFMFKEHYHGASKRGGICSSGPLFSNRQLRDPCYGCEIFWEDVSKNKGRPKNERQKKRISTRDMFAFTWWDYGLWYHAPRLDKDGRVATNDQGQPYLDWVMGVENDQRYAGCQWKYGHLLAWPMGETYKETLLSQNDYISQDCQNCSARSAIQFVSKNCAHCGAVVYDASTTLSPEQREQVDNAPYSCQCGNVGFLIEMINCSNCGDGKRASIFDVDLQITAVGTKGQQTFLQIINRSEPRQIQVQDPEVLKTIGPLDLAKKFSPTPLNKQAEMWGITPMQAPHQAAPQAAPQPGPMAHVPGPVSQAVMGAQGTHFTAPPTPPPAATPAMAPPSMGVPGMAPPAAPMPPQQAAPPQQPPQQAMPPAMPGMAPQPGMGQPAPGFQPPQQAAPVQQPALPGAPGLPTVPYNTQGGSQ